MFRKVLASQQAGLVIVIVLLGAILTASAGTHVDRVTGEQVNVLMADRLRFGGTRVEVAALAERKKGEPHTHVIRAEAVQRYSKTLTQSEVR